MEGLKEMQNANPTILNPSQLPSRSRGKKTTTRSARPESKYDHILFAKHGSSWPSDEEDDQDEAAEEPIDELEIYELISTLSDPEHPYTLGQLSVINLPDIQISPPPSRGADPNKLVMVTVLITPTVIGCSFSNVIGLAVRIRLEQALPPNYRVRVQMKPGSSVNDEEINKQLADKERVAAAQENQSLMNVVREMMQTCT